MRLHHGTYSVTVAVEKLKLRKVCNRIDLLDDEAYGTGLRDTAFKIWRDVVLSSDTLTLAHGVATDDTLPEITDAVWRFVEAFRVNNALLISQHMHELPREHYPPPRKETVVSVLRRLCHLFSLCDYLSIGSSIGWYLLSDTAIAYPQDTPRQVLIITRIAPKVVRKAIGKAGSWLTTNLGFAVGLSGDVRALFGAGVKAVHPLEVGWVEIGHTYCDNDCESPNVIGLEAVLERIHSKEVRELMTILRHTKPLIYGYPAHLAPDIEAGTVRAVLKATVSYPDMTPDEVAKHIPGEVRKVLKGAPGSGVVMRRTTVSQHVNTVTVTLEASLIETEPARIAEDVKALADALNELRRERKSEQKLV